MPLLLVLGCETVESKVVCDLAGAVGGRRRDGVDSEEGAEGNVEEERQEVGLACGTHGD